MQVILFDFITQSGGGNVLPQGELSGGGIARGEEYVRGNMSRGRGKCPSTAMPNIA